MGVSSERQSGRRRLSPTGSMTAPERICAPTSDPFSTTTNEMSGLICLRRIALAKPEGPAPTITTSNSIASRAGSSAMSVSCFPASLAPNQPDRVYFGHQLAYDPKATADALERTRKFLDDHMHC